MFKAPTLALTVLALVTSLATSANIKQSLQHNIDTLIEAETSASTFKSGLIVPLYITPTATGTTCTSSAWKTVASSAIANRTIAVANPNNGPVTGSTAATAAYTACINLLRSKGVKVVGYVHTKLGYPDIYAYRAYSDVVTDINLWKS